MTVHLYVAADLQTFEVPEDTALALDVTQGDQDCRRAYRRLDGRWWAWLARMHQGMPSLARLRARVVELRGDAAVAKAEAMTLPHDYFPPLPLFPSISQVTHAGH